MHRSSSTHTDWVAVLIVAALAVVFLFSRSLGVNFETGADVLAKTVGALLIGGALLYIQAPWKWIVPVTLTFLWMAFWPALNYASVTDFERHLGHAVFSTPWYGTMLFKFAGLLGCLATYLLFELTERRS